jgi:hypothetical protein
VAQLESYLYIGEVDVHQDGVNRTNENVASSIPKWQQSRSDERPTAGSINHGFTKIEFEPLFTGR